VADEAPGPYLRAWLATFRAAARYFRFDVEGFENLERAPASVIVGYHGGPWAYDLFMLSVLVHERLGYFPRAIFARPFSWFPVLRDMVAELGGLYGEPDAAAIEDMRARRRHLFVLPGGMREALRPFWRRHAVDWGGRTGYLRLALRHGLPILPLAATGLESTYVGLNDGYALSRRIFGKGDVPLWLGVGMGGLWPFALPWPAKIRQRIGAPIDVAAMRRAGESDRDLIARADAHVRATIQGLIDGMRGPFDSGLARFAGLALRSG
jgi:1-acyl-sn-glycerol-3-phosphate acyltransferase